MSALLMDWSRSCAGTGWLVDAVSKLLRAEPCASADSCASASSDTGGRATTRPGSLRGGDGIGGTPMRSAAALGTAESSRANSGADLAGSRPAACGAAAAVSAASGGVARPLSMLHSAWCTSAISELVRETEPASEAAHSAMIWCRSEAELCTSASALSFTAHFSARMVSK